LFKRIRGEAGEVSVTSIGAVVARCEPNGWWELRRADPQPEDSTLTVWSLRAIFSYVNPTLFGDPRFAQEFRVKLGDKLFRLDMPAERMALNGRSLQAEGVTLCQLSPT
jgi:hypothetical protein